MEHFGTAVFSRAVSFREYSLTLWRNVMLNFTKEGMKQLHILSEGINFPVAIPVYTDWQETQFALFFI